MFERTCHMLQKQLLQLKQNLGIATFRMLLLQSLYRSDLTLLSISKHHSLFSSCDQVAGSTYYSSFSRQGRILGRRRVNTGQFRWSYVTRRRHIRPQARILSQRSCSCAPCDSLRDEKDRLRGPTHHWCFRRNRRGGMRRIDIMIYASWSV